MTIYNYGIYNKKEKKWKLLFDEKIRSHNKDLFETLACSENIHTQTMFIHLLSNHITGVCDINIALFNLRKTMREKGEMKFPNSQKAEKDKKWFQFW